MIGRIWTVARREIKAMFDHPTGYVLLVVFVAVNAFMYFREAYLMGQATLRPMLDLLPWLFLFFVPAVAMRTLAEDSRSGVLELVLAQPVTELELLLGKFLGAVAFLWIGLACTLPIPLGLTLGAKLYWGPVVAQYAGAAMLALGLAGVGVWASSLTRSQITAFILAVAVMFVLILFGLDPLLVGLPPALGTIAARLGVLSHFQNIGRGVIDLRDAIYFLSLAGVFLALAYGAVLGRKLSRTGPARRRLRLGVALVAAILVVVNLLGSYINGRLDLTPGHAYTLSRGTKQIVGHLDDLVTIKEFASDALPTSIALLKRDVDDLLRDVRSASHGNVRVLVRDPSSDKAAASEAQSLGIAPVQFNVVGNASLQVKQGYLGLAIEYRGKSQAIPFVGETDDLEYRVASAIRELTRTTKPVVGVFAGAAGPMGATQRLQRELQKSYSVRTFTLADTAQPAADVKTLVLVGGPDSIPAAARARLAAFFDRGGSALVLASGMLPDAQMPMAIPHPVGWNPLLARFGVSIPSDMVYDLAANEIVPVPSQMGQVLTRYPLFMQAQSTGRSVVDQQVDNVLLPWASSVDTTAKPGYVITPLLVTSRGGGVLTGEQSIQPTRDWPQDSLASRLVAVQVAPAAKDSAARGRVIVVGNTDFVTDRIAQQAPENLDFALNAVDWLTQDDALISIRAKNRRPPALAFTSAATRDGVKYFNVIGVPLLLIVAGLAATSRRRRRTRTPYRPLAAVPGGAA
ncbi:MAG TPA: Gldg family protein [Gemmatimonadaceae bacterium]|nr:Gldg family protein [Gemmatimonadaceae bacterium]